MKPFPHSVFHVFQINLYLFLVTENILLSFRSWNWVQTHLVVNYIAKRSMGAKRTKVARKTKLLEIKTPSTLACWSSRGEIWFHRLLDLELAPNKTNEGAQKQQDGTDIQWYAQSCMPYCHLIGRVLLSRSTLLAGQTLFTTILSRNRPQNIALGIIRSKYLLWFLALTPSKGVSGTESYRVNGYSRTNTVYKHSGWIWGEI